MKFSSSELSESEIQSFLSAGFIPALNEGSPETEVYLTKSVTCSDFPYVLKHVVDDNIIHPEYLCSIDVLNNGNIQLYFHEPDYAELYHKTDSREAWLEIAKDAGVNFQ